MSTGWSIWVMALVTINLSVILFLYLWAPRARIPTARDGTTGHAWAGGNVREGLRRLPLWWVLISAGLFVATFTYLILFPGFGANPGLLGWGSHDRLATKQAANQAKLTKLEQRARLYSVTQLAGDGQVTQRGGRLFGDNCAACHGTRATGNQGLGAPDLTDNVWLYGGDGDTLVKTITTGRHGTMPAWDALGEDTVDNLVQYVLSLSGRDHDSAMADQAEATFKSTCAACHSQDGTGKQALGAPNLTDDVWLHGASEHDIHQTIHDGRKGHMPNWDERLSENQIRMLAAYVYSLSDHDHDDE